MTHYLFNNRIGMLCFSCHLQQSAETELSTASVRQLPQHVSSKQHLCHSGLLTSHLLLLLSSAPERPRHGYTSAHSDIIFIVVIIVLFLPPGQPVAAEYLSDRRRHLAVRCCKSEPCTQIFRYVVVI